MIIREPKMVRNDGADFECFSGGALYQFKSGESRLLDGETAYQILNNQKTPLVEVDVMAAIAQESKAPEQPETLTVPQASLGVVDYNAMTYKELRTIASQKKIFKVGTSKEKLVELLNGQQ